VPKVMGSNPWKKARFVSLGGEMIIASSGGELSPRKKLLHVPIENGLLRWMRRNNRPGIFRYVRVLNPSIHWFIPTYLYMRS
jgi:hypothetical protein